MLIHSYHLSGVYNNKTGKTKKGHRDQSSSPLVNFQARLRITANKLNLRRGREKRTLLDSLYRSLRAFWHVGNAMVQLATQS